MREFNEINEQAAESCIRCNSIQVRLQQVPIHRGLKKKEGGGGADSSKMLGLHYCVLKIFFLPIFYSFNLSLWKRSEHLCFVQLLHFLSRTILLELFQTEELWQIYFFPEAAEITKNEVREYFRPAKFHFFIYFTITTQFLKFELVQTQKKAC